jgi:hypothetical protein
MRGSASWIRLADSDAALHHRQVVMAGSRNPLCLLVRVRVLLKISAFSQDPPFANIKNSFQRWLLAGQIHPS